jgi:excisionase family DNA binding protein
MELLTPEEVSDLTGLSVETLAQWRSQKKHFPFIKLGRLVRYDREDVDRYFETCRVSVSQTRRQK